MKIKIEDQRIRDLPLFGSSYAAAIDLYACLCETVCLYPEQLMPVTTGIRVELKENTVGLLVPRSGKGTYGLVLANGIGVIDPDYRGIIIAMCLNRNPAGTRAIEIKPMDRIAQLLVVPVCRGFEFVDELGQTDRGSHGFGSSDGQAS